MLVALIFFCLPDIRAAYPKLLLTTVPLPLPCLAFTFRAKTVISNATRWDTFEKMIEGDHLPVGEQLFRCDAGGVVANLPGSGLGAVAEGLTKRK